ncbi:MAG: polysaccharide biosynthesis C-terminal domain-containing protein [Pseudomonadota bacterium]|nr:polysaccharide biosynthesis C-terminal domain-containing protein [Pseudomonadota bacterium]
MDSVARGTVVNLVARTLTVFGVLAITTLTARLGPAVQGAFALFVSVEGACAALLSGFGIALARRVSHHGEHPRALLSAVVLACIALGAVMALALTVVARHAPPAYASLWILALAAPLLLLAPNLAGLWLGAGRMVPMAALTLAPPWLALALLAPWWLLAVFTAAPLTLSTVLGSWVAAKVLVALVLLFVLWRGARLVRPGFAALGRELPFIATIGVTNLVALANYRVGLFVVERTMGLSATGVYSIAVAVAELLWFVSSSLTQAVYGRIGTPDRAVAAATTLRAVHLSLAALLAVAPALMLGAVLVLPRLLGAVYAESLLPLAILLPGVSLFGGASALSAYFTNHAGMPSWPARVALLSLLLNAALSVLLVPALGMAGAALAASLAYTVSVVVLALLFVRHAGLPASSLLPGAALQRDLLDGAARLRRVLRRSGGAGGR